MNKHRIQSHGDLKGEMKSVARGARRPPAEAAEPSFNSVGALLRLLTPENRALLNDRLEP
jgi:predicted transcriptional regulator